MLQTPHTIPMAKLSTDEIIGYFKSQGIEWDKMSPELRQEALKVSGQTDTGFIEGARNVGASTLEGFTGLLGLAGTGAGLVTYGAGKAAEALGAGGVGSSLKSAGASILGGVESGQKTVSKALRSEADLAQREIEAKKQEKAFEDAGGGVSGFAAQTKQFLADQSFSDYLGLVTNLAAQGLGTGLIAKKLLKEASTVAAQEIAKGATKEAAEQAQNAALKLAATKIAGVSGGQTGLDTAGTTYQQIMDIPDKTWMVDDEYRDRVVAGENPTKVKQDIAMRKASLYGAAGAATGTVAGKALGNPLESALATILGAPKQAAKTVGRSLLAKPSVQATGKVVGTGIAEGAEESFTGLSLIHI